MTGVVVGVPAGLFVARIAWRLVANGLGIQSTMVFPPLILVFLVAGTFLIFNLVGIIPARFASRIRPAEALRTE